MNEEELWISFQLCDSAFPGGCLANSQGLESALHHGLVERNNSDSLFAFLSMSVEQAIWLQLPFIRTAHQFNSNSDKGAFLALDTYFHALVNNDIARRASINQGKCFLRAIRDSFPAVMDRLDYFTTLTSDESLSSSYRTHFAPLFGLTCGLLKISLPLCDRMFLRMLMRDIVSSATRLSIIGPMKGSHIQASLTSVIESLLLENQKALNTSQDHASDDTDECSVKFYKNLKPVMTMPVLEFVQSRHDLMYTRLFNT